MPFYILFWLLNEFVLVLGVLELINSLLVLYKIYIFYNLYMLEVVKTKYGLSCVEIADMVHSDLR